MVCCVVLCFILLGAGLVCCVKFYSLKSGCDVVTCFVINKNIIRLSVVVIHAKPRHYLIYGNAQVLMPSIVAVYHHKVAAVLRSSLQKEYFPQSECIPNLDQYQTIHTDTFLIYVQPHRLWFYKNNRLTFDLICIYWRHFSKGGLNEIQKNQQTQGYFGPNPGLLWTKPRATFDKTQGYF
jgi:hypothetical protein